MELKIHDQEVHLQRFWLKYGLKCRDIKSMAGSKIEVLSVGTLNHDAGPDFKDAVIKVDDQVICGDVEIHLDSSGWYAHKHASDPAYNRVILHVVSEQTSDELYVKREDGVKVHQILLDCDDKNEDTPKSLPLHEMDKVNCLLRREKAPVILSGINKAAELRFDEKVAQLQEDLLWTSWEQLIFIRICEALGYSKNQKPFRKLAERLHFDKIRQIMQWVPEEVALDRCAALLFGTAGLLKDAHIESFLDQSSLHKLANLWDHFQHTIQVKPMYAHEWQFFRLRPHNFPTRRIAGLAILLHRFKNIGFIDSFTRLIQSHSSKKKLLSNLYSAISVPDCIYLKSPDVPSDKSKPALIGRDRAKDIVVNIVLPVMYLYFETSKEGQLRNTVLECYRLSPKLSENVIVRAMCEQLNADYDADLALNDSAYRQQGLLYLYKNYCRYQKCRSCLQTIT